MLSFQIAEYCSRVAEMLYWGQTGISLSYGHGLTGELLPFCHAKHGGLPTIFGIR